MLLEDMTKGYDAISRSQSDRGRSFIAELGSVLFPSSNQERLISVWQAYFDESEPGGDVPLLAIAGYVSTERLWQKFESAWNEMLREFGIRTYFHMADFIACRGEFNGWDEKPDKRKRCISKAISIIQEYTYMRVSCTVALPDYDFIVKGAEPDNKNIAKAFTLCGSTAMSSIEKWTRDRGSTEKIAYVFEQGNRHCGEILATFNQSPKSARVLRTMYRLGTVAHAFKEDAVMLQAADMLAHQTARFVADKTRGIRSAEMYLPVLHQLPLGISWVYKPESLREFLKETFDVANAKRLRGYRKNAEELKP